MMTLKKILILGLMIILVACSSQEKGPKIGVVQLVEHTSLNIIRDSIFEELDNLGYGKQNIVYVNAQADMTSISTIIQKMKADKVDVLIAITTPVAQAAIPITDEIPLVFSAVSSPITAGLLESDGKNKPNITGTSDAISVDKIMDLALKINRDVKTVGYIYNPMEANSVANLEKLEKYLSTTNIKIEKSAISSSSELQTASRMLVSKSDIIFAPNDNTVAEAMQILASEAIKAQVPVYTGSDSMVIDGGFASVGIDYTDLGKASAVMADRIVKNESASDIHVEVFDKNLNIYINMDTLNKLNIQVDSSILEDPKLIKIGE